MVAFSREDSKKRAIVIKVRRAKNQARGSSPSMKLKHPDWCRDANKGDYTMLIKEITKQCQDKQAQNEKYRSKLHAVKS